MSTVPATRWYVKKAARKAMVLGAWAGGLLPAITQDRRPRIRVLTYHRFGPAVHDPFCVAAEQFDAQMRWLAEQRLAVSLADLEDHLAGRKRLADGSVLVTVDDGFRSVARVMLPALRRYAIPAVAFVSPGLIAETPDSSHATPEPYLTWDELAAVAEAGMTIGSHGWSHRSLGQIGFGEAEDEMRRSRETLQAHLGQTVTSLAYPYGTRADYNPMTTALLAATGYTTAFTSQHGAVLGSDDPLVLPRVKVEGGEGLWMFAQICRGGMDAWRLVDRTLWRVQLAR